MLYPSSEQMNLLHTHCFVYSSNIFFCIVRILFKQENLSHIHREIEKYVRHTDWINHYLTHAIRQIRMKRKRSMVAERFFSFNYRSINEV